MNEGGEDGATTAAIHRLRPRPEPDPRGGVVSFDRAELGAILGLYGRRVAEGEWRDYAIDFSAEKATFSIYRRTSEVPLYRVDKVPALARRQGLYTVTNGAGLILKRGSDLARVLSVLDRRPKLVLV